MSNKDYERGFIDGMQEQLNRIVDKSVNGLDACASECLGLRSTVNDQHQIIMDLLSKDAGLSGSPIRNDSIKESEAMAQVCEGGVK